MGLYLKVQLGQSCHRPYFLAIYGGVSALIVKLQAVIRRVPTVSIVANARRRNSGPVVRYFRLGDHMVFE